MLWHRQAVVGASTLIASGLVVRWLWAVLTAATAPARSGAPQSADEVLVALAAAAALVTICWLTLGMLLEAVAVVPGRVGAWAASVSATVSPVVVRRAAGMLLGATLGATLAPGPSVAAPTTSAVRTGAFAASSHDPLPDPAFAAPSVTQHPHTSSSDPPTDDTSSPPSPSATPDTHIEDAGPPDPGFGPPRASGFVPEPPVVRPQPDVSVIAPPARRAPTWPEPASVVVHRGDSLWSIAARHLGPHPSDGEIAHEWPRWFAANRSVIGDDPDLLLPGQVLTAPGQVRS